MMCLSFKSLFGLAFLVLWPALSSAAAKTDDLRKLAKSLPLQKGEFETTDQYSARLEPFPARAYAVTGAPSAVAYDADREAFKVDPKMVALRICSKHRSYTARTRMTWHLQDRYEFADLMNRTKSSKPEIDAESMQISAECKKARPASLGPDPGP